MMHDCPGHCWILHGKVVASWVTLPLKYVVRKMGLIRAVRLLIFSAKIKMFLHRSLS